MREKEKKSFDAGRQLKRKTKEHETKEAIDTCRQFIRKGEKRKREQKKPFDACRHCKTQQRTKVEKVGKGHKPGKAQALALRHKQAQAPIKAAAQCKY
eukprot:1156545-Pelagomonas_calceolata.AAC.2